MNILPNIDGYKKKFRFSNPLSGLVYNNNNYLKQCQYEPDLDGLMHTKRRVRHQRTHSLV